MAGVVADIKAVGDLVGKTISFAAQVRDDWYKGSAEVAGFKIKVQTLRVKHDDWTKSLQKAGMTDDESLKSLVEQANQILDEEQKYVEKLQKGKVKKFIRKAFPGKLTNIVELLLMTVGASQQLLETRVASNDLLQRSSSQTPDLLPYGPDHKYVPILKSVAAVRKALENVNGRRVVTVHGVAGIGKTSLVKYLSLLYLETGKSTVACSSTSSPACFTDGVFYLFCGEGADTKQLQLDLLRKLGWAATPSSDSTIVPEQDGETIRKLRFRLKEQKTLIILDDIWETKVLEKLLVPGTGLKYLITSQIRDIWGDAEMIELNSPNMEESRKIMANYTQGLPTQGEFPDGIQRVTDNVIRQLECHPLSLANIGLSINRRRAIDPDAWEEANESIRDELGQDMLTELSNSPIVYDAQYPRTVASTMMLMVNNLDSEARRLLFLVSLLKGAEVPEDLVKYFIKRIQPTQPRSKYNNHLNYLENRSLVTLRGLSGIEINTEGDLGLNRSTSSLAVHGLRAYFIRKMKTVELRSIAKEVIWSGKSSTDGGASILQSGDTTDDTFAMILGAMYFDKSFADVIESKLQNQVIIIEDDVPVPRSLSTEDVDIRALMKKTLCNERNFQSLVWLFNFGREGGWRQEAYGHAKKILLRFFFRGELDDESMARLIQLSNTTASVCKALKRLLKSYTISEDLETEFVVRNRTFSSAHGKTTKSLAVVLQSNDVNPRVAAIGALGHVLNFESEDTILSVTKKLVDLAAKDSSPTLQKAFAHAIHQGEEICLRDRKAGLMGAFPGVLERLLMLVTEANGRNICAAIEAVRALYVLSRIAPVASKMVTIPGALQTLFEIFRAGSSAIGSSCSYYSRTIMCNLSRVPECGIRRFGEIVQGGLEGLSEMVASRNDPSSPAVSRLREDWDKEEAAIMILGNLNLGLTKQHRETISVKFPEISQNLNRFKLECLTRQKDYPKQLPYWLSSVARVSTTITILDRHDPQLQVGTPAPSFPPWASYGLYKGRAHAHREMEIYAEALQDVHNARHHLQLIVDDELRSGNEELTHLREMEIFLKAKLEDYEGALIDANNYIQEGRGNYYTEGCDFAFRLLERGVLFRLSGHLAEALVDLDSVHMIACNCHYSTHIFLQYDCLRHRGYIKYVMGDEAGAVEDEELAQQFKLRKLVGEKTGCTCELCSSDYSNSCDVSCTLLRHLPVNYLGFAF